MTRNSKNDKRDPYNVPAVDQAARVLFCLAQNSGTHMSLTEICAKVGLHTSRAFSLLHTLQKFELAQRNVGGKGYSLGFGLMELSRKVLDDLHVPKLAEPFLKDLAIASDSTSVLGIKINENELIIAGKYEGGSDVGVTVRVGRRVHISHSAEGKAIAAFLPEEDLKKMLQQKRLYFYGQPEHFDKRRLMKEIVECRRLGYATDLEEIKQGLNAVAAPLLGHHGLPIGFISILGLLSSSLAQELGPSVANAAKTLSRQLGAKVE